MEDRGMSDLVWVAFAKFTYVAYLPRVLNWSADEK